MYSTSYPSLQQPLSPWTPSSAEPPNSAQSWKYLQYLPSGISAWLPATETPLRHGLQQLLRVRGELSHRLPRTHLRPQVAILVPRVTVPDHRRRTWARNPTTTSYDSSSGQPTSGWFGSDNAQQAAKEEKEEEAFLRGAELGWWARLR
jgi:hypothetical protein